MNASAPKAASTAAASPEKPPFLGFGLGWAILAHTLYNLTARSFYAAYLIRT